MTVPLSNEVISVKALNHMVKNFLIESIGQIWLVGEISNFSKPSSGHWYFTLKDDCAQVRCAMFRHSNLAACVLPQNGQKVMVHATVTLYEARGEYQLVIDQLQAAGIGVLQQQFEQLKQRLDEEGLFDARYKKSLPVIIRRVGIVTSLTGAVLHDICQILKRRDPSLHLIIYPSLVQGNEAANQISKMITIANERHECDVLIVARGGGSLEDLWPFNEEIVARAIFSSTLPIISAIGHEIDFTIADFVADVRAATPSAAAELISKNKDEQLNRLKNTHQHLSMAMDYLILQQYERYRKLCRRLLERHPEIRLIRYQGVLAERQNRLVELFRQQLSINQRHYQQLANYLILYSPLKRLAHDQLIIKNLATRMNYLIQKTMKQTQHELMLVAEKLDNISPIKTLARGYSITLDENSRLIMSPKQVSAGQKIITQIEKGKIISEVIKTY